MTILDAALVIRAAGISIIPIDHRTKRPASRLLPIATDENGQPILDDKGKPKRTWEPYQHQIADEATVRGWFKAGIKAFAVVGGKVSGGLCVLDVDEPRFRGGWGDLVGEQARGLPEQLTGGGGNQLAWRCPNPGKNDKLAWVPDENEETGRRIAIETRGEGGYAVVAPSLHPTGNRYEMLVGSFADIPTLSQEQADALLEAARKLDEAPKTRQQLEKEARQRSDARRAGLNGETRVIDAYNKEHTISELLERYGYRRNGDRYIRPGGSGSSVSVKDGRSYHHNTNDPLCDGFAHDAFDLYRFKEHDGDMSKAVKAAAQELGMEYHSKAYGQSQGSEDPVPATTLDAILGELGKLKPVDGVPDRSAVEKRATQLVRVAALLSASEALEVAQALESLGARANFIREWQRAVGREAREARRQQRDHGDKPKTEDYINALSELGYRFRLNECDDDIEVNGEPISDALRAKIRAQMRDRGFIHVNVMEDAYAAHAYDNRYHPIKEYLRSLRWDGNDYIGDLSAYLPDIHDAIVYHSGERRAVFHAWLLRWLIGAIAKVMDGEQNAMLVIDGPQDIGKSHFVRWLGSPLPDYYIEGAVNPDDKDAYIRLISKWVWEVAELGATTRKADREALKDFITKQIVTVRKSYGRHDINKKAMASLIGTINNESGFLNDPTGSRRFLVCTIKEINWGYVSDLDPNQPWAQAYSLYMDGEPWRLLPEEKRMQKVINGGYEVENTLEWYLRQVCEVNPSDETAWAQTGEVVNRIQTLGWKGATRQLEMDLAALALSLGLKRKRERNLSGYLGLRIRVQSLLQQES